MRTITASLKNRLVAQAEEAEFQGYETVAEQLKEQIAEAPTRSDFEEYVYSHVDLSKDVEKLLWAAAVRTQDYFGKTADAIQIESIISEAAAELIASIRNKIGGDIVGPNEPIVPGEERLVVEID
jgi:replicative superfamily II helicase